MAAILNSKELPNVISVSEELSEALVKDNSVFTNQFYLIVSSSVCGFLPNCERSLSVLKSALKPGGIFLQWDWLSNTDESDFGFSHTKIESVYRKIGLTPSLIEETFSVQTLEGDMPVIRGVAVDA